MPLPVSKNIISFVVKLHQLKYRNESQLFIVEGEKMVSELLDSGLTVKFICCVEEFYNEHSLQLGNFSTYLVTESELSKISLLQTPNKVMAVVEQPGFLPINFQKEGIFLLLDGIRDPGNMGTIFRTAEWFGVNSIVCSLDCVDVFNPKVVQGSMGSVFRMPVLMKSLTDAITDFRNNGVDCIMGAVLDGVSLSTIQTYFSAKVLIIGSEAKGISEEVKKALTHKVSIMPHANSKAESLNAAVATGILLNELVSK